MIQESVRWVVNGITPQSKADLRPSSPKANWGADFLHG